MGQATTSETHERRPSESGAVRAVRGELPTAPRPILLLGRGGMGRVELAVEQAPGQAKRLVAVKRLLAELVGDPEKRALFHREVTLAKRLEHPNVVRTRDSGEEDGEPFLVMDFVDGVPLDRLLAGAGDARERALPRELAAYVVGRVARGLHAAHELHDEGGTPLNLVHRDVSPHNVMVSREGDVLLLDFGVAKVDAERGLTKTGDVRGKTAYMSPEQGLGEPLDRRSDLFALGAVLFECVEGARMWGEGTEMDVLRRLALEAPPALGGDDALADLHARMVAREPADRPATAEEVAGALSLFAE
ncbi:MAG TPA: serine/threonine-protein kinase, partial [Polyangiaceae bacterium]|nr:serine/threonine-protein kinase [Polyangiaceae bacterium]